MTTTQDHKLMEVAQKTLPPLYGYKESAEKEDKAWKARCRCDTVWYGTRQRVLNSHRWHHERETGIAP